MPTNSFSFDKEKAIQYFASGFNSFLERKHIKAPDIAKEIENSLVKMIGDNKKEIERLKMELELLRK